MAYTVALGGILHLVRAHNRWSVETAAAKCGIGHMTWRRLEEGTAVRAGTYAAVESLLNLDMGDITRALSSAEAMVELARKLGINVSSADNGIRSAESLMQDHFAPASAAGYRSAPVPDVASALYDLTLAVQDLAAAVRTGGAK